MLNDFDYEFLTPGTPTSEEERVSETSDAYELSEVDSACTSSGDTGYSSSSSSGYLTPAEYEDTPTPDAAPVTWHAFPIHHSQDIRDDIPRRIRRRYGVEIGVIDFNIQ